MYERGVKRTARCFPHFLESQFKILQILDPNFAIISILARWNRMIFVTITIGHYRVLLLSASGILLYLRGRADAAAGTASSATSVRMRPEWEAAA
jgi:hypothetical protein